MCRQPSACRVTEVGPRPTDRARNAASAFWPLRNERRAPAEHPGTSSLSTLGPSLTSVILPAALVIQLPPPPPPRWQQDRQQRVNTRRPRFRAESHLVSTVGPSENEAFGAFLLGVFSVAIPLKRHSLPFHDTPQRCFIPEANSCSLPTLSSSSPHQSPQLLPDLEALLATPPPALERIIKLGNPRQVESCSGCPWLCLLPPWSRLVRGLLSELLQAATTAAGQ